MSASQPSRAISSTGIGVPLASRPLPSCPAMVSRSAITISVVEAGRCRVGVPAVSVLSVRFEPWAWRLLGVSVLSVRFELWVRPSAGVSVLLVVFEVLARLVPGVSVLPAASELRAWPWVGLSALPFVFGGCGGLRVLPSFPSRRCSHLYHIKSRVSSQGVCCTRCQVS